MGSYAYLPLERVVFGQPAAPAVAEEVARIGARRVFIVSSRSLSRNTPVIREMADALGPKYAGLFDECIAHTPWPSVIAAADAVRAADPDLILTVGGGTPIDTVKILQICLAHGAKRVDAVEIDPAIIRLGRELHPEKPYSDPRVTVHNDDARHFLRTSTKKYDLVVFALIANRRLVSATASVEPEDGFTVRNVTACHLAGVCPGEIFDVTPYAKTVALHMLRNPLNQSLPRKFKIAFHSARLAVVLVERDGGTVADADPGDLKGILDVEDAKLAAKSGADFRNAAFSMASNINSPLCGAASAFSNPFGPRARSVCAARRKRASSEFAAAFKRGFQASPQARQPAEQRAALETLDRVQRRVLWLAVSMVHHANKVRQTGSGVKVGGHQASRSSRSGHG